MTAISVTNIFGTSQSVGSSTAVGPWRQWMKHIGDGIVATGAVVRVSTPGSLDLSSAPAATPTNGTIAGYEIFAFNDALQTTAPIFIKLEYGNQGSYATIWMTVATAHDGTGTLTGQVSTRFTLGTYASMPNNPSYFSGDAANGRVAAFPTPNSSNSSSIGFIVERARDTTGGPTSGDIVLWCFTGGTPYAQAWTQVIPRTGTVPAWESGIPALTPGSGTSTSLASASDNEITMFPITPWSRARLILPAMSSALVYLDSDTTVYTPVTVNFYSNSATFLPLGNLNNLRQTPGIGRPGTGCALAMRFD